MTVSRRAFFRGLAGLGALPLALALPPARGQSAGPCYWYSAPHRWEFVKIGPKSRIIGEYEEIGRKHWYEAISPPEAFDIADK